MKIDRLFSIINILIDKKVVTAAELSKHFNVSIRTIYRDIDILSCNGVPVYCTKGKGGGISILDSYYIDKAILSEKEQKQVLTALQSVEATKQVDVKESLIKLNSLFRKDTSDWIEIDFSGWQQSEAEKEYFTIIKESIINLMPISFSYFSNKGEESKRIAEPIKLVFKGTQWYLYAYCRSREDFRFFKLSRMENLKPINDKFSKRDSKIKIENNYKEELIEMKLKIDKSMASRVYDEFRHGRISIEENTFIIDIKLPKAKWIYGYLLGYGDSLEILEPLEIRSKFKEEVSNIVKKYL